jgi:hypothetical protein
MRGGGAGCGAGLTTTTRVGGTGFTTTISVFVLGSVEQAVKTKAANPAATK